MTHRRFGLLLFLLTTAGCASHQDGRQNVHYGVYLPDCKAFEGDRVELREDGFTWSRFTDQRKIDESGNEVDSFPEFPKSGEYQMKDGHVSFTLDDGEHLDTRYFMESGGKAYLLSQEEDRVFAEGGQMPECALRRIGE